MDIKNITCIECPKGCLLFIDIEGGRVSAVRGAKCPKGIGYAITEAEDPVRLLTSAVLAEGLSIKMVPVRTNKPIPKRELGRAMEEIKRMRVTAPVSAGSILADNFLGLGVKLIVTREASRG